MAERAEGLAAAAAAAAAAATSQGARTAHAAHTAHTAHEQGGHVADGSEGMAGGEGVQGWMGDGEVKQEQEEGGASNRWQAQQAGHVDLTLPATHPKRQRLADADCVHHTDHMVARAHTRSTSQGEGVELQLMHSMIEDLQVRICFT